jgi:hypothetical protein
MKSIREKNHAKHTDGQPTANYAAILAILAEMARQVNMNISKIDLAPISGRLLARDGDLQD